MGFETIPSFGKETYTDIAKDYFLYAFSYIFFFYLYYFLLSEKHINGKKIAAKLLSGFTILIIFTTVSALIYVYVLYPEIFNLNSGDFIKDFAAHYLNFMEVNFVFAVFGVLIKSAEIWYRNNIIQKEIEKNLILSELALLKSQINPKFLFSSLNEIKSLALNQPGKAISGIEFLSEIMSFMLYETSEDKILLDDEIRNINNYINLQKIKYGNGTINFSAEGNTSGIYVPPLLFMPLMENVFGPVDLTGVNRSVNIKILCENDLLIFNAEFCTEDKSIFISENENIRLESLTRRLDLLYGKNYTLKTRNEIGCRYISLELKK